jgi:hypothetical protein
MEKTQNFPQTYVRSASWTTTGKLFATLISRTTQKHAECRNLLNESQFAFRAHHSMTLQCMKLADHSNNNTSAAVVSLDIEQAFDKAWDPGLHKL